MKRRRPCMKSALFDVLAVLALFFIAVAVLFLTP